MEKKSYLKYFKKNYNTNPKTYPQTLLTQTSHTNNDNKSPKQNKFNQQIINEDKQNVFRRLKLKTQGKGQIFNTKIKKRFEIIHNNFEEQKEQINLIKNKNRKLQTEQNFLQEKITNSFHEHKIQNPRQSYEKSVKKLQSSSLYNPNATQQKFILQPIRPYDRNKTAPNKKFRTLKTTFGDLNSSCRNYNDYYTISLQNQRMGWRIFNTKSMIQQYLNNTYFTYHLYNGTVLNKQKFKSKDSKQKKKVNLKQMNNVMKVFFNQKTLSQIKNNSSNLHQKVLSQFKPQDQMQQYILSQSRFKQNTVKTQSDSYSSKIAKKASIQNNYLIIQDKKLNDGQIVSPTKNKPSFFRSSYRKTDYPLNRKICQQKQKPNNSFYFGKYPQKTIKKYGCLTQPNVVQSQIFCKSYQNEIFGIGSTIIQLKDIQIEANPSLKCQDIVMLQLMDKNIFKKQAKGICSSPIAFSQLKKGIKFAINLKTGDFIPLKIWKYHGINMVELGIIDINLVIFKNRKKYFQFTNLEFKPINQNFSQSNGIQQIQLYKQKKSNPNHNRDQQRQILFYRLQQKLRKNKKIQIDTKISLNCLIYNKKFYFPMKNNINLTQPEEL